MTETKSEKEGKKESRISVDITGSVLMAAMEIRAKREKESGKPTSLAGIVREAVLTLHREEIGEGKEAVEQ
jgi:hypothetical protein